ncbi:hypothetical protein MKW98_018438 [Papaver atlanticum]|uniref:IRK-interacting protein n=1 Tax=Papaver atlanticum TaxID=357466 RepID=A0AAD4T3Q9_9MAGN|nr:hypothetical protein MKW98_018438 [Papaver atlanticum]
MAATTTSRMFQNNNEISRQEIQGAIAKAVELRALHASLMQNNNSNNSPANLRVYPTSASPSIFRHSSQLSSQEYPVFTPSYEEDPLPGYQQIQLNSQVLSENWDGFGLERGAADEDETDYISDYKKEPSLRNTLSPSSFNRMNPTFEDHKSFASSCTNHLTVLQSSPNIDIFKSSRRIGSEEIKSVTTCNRCKPATISTEAEIYNNNMINNNNKSSSNLPPVSDSHSLSHQSSQTKNKGQILTRLFAKLKKKNKSEKSPNRAESEDMSQMFKELGIMSVESLKKELLEANENKTAALMEVAEMKSSLGDLKQKLEYLENYCEELKNALKQTVQGRETQVSELSGGGVHSKRGKSIDISREDFMPVSHEAMVEGFLQIVSEARLSVKHFCKTLVSQIEETDSNLMDKLNLLLQPYKLNLNSRYSKAVLYHLEALINQSLYQDFENCVFQKNGTPKVLDPNKQRKAQFSSFVALRNLSWNEVLRKGTKYYSEEFSKFCDQKMSCIISTLNWSRPWPEQLLQSFFVSAKCIWLLHLLAFSFSPPISILRVDQNRNFDSHFMEDILMERQKLQQSPVKVKIMVMPGFYVQDKILKSKVICRHEL